MTFRGGRLPASPWYCIFSGTRAGVLTLFLGTFDQLRRYLVAAVFYQRRVLRFPAGLLAGYPFCSVCGVVSFVSGIRVLGLGPFPF